jgi:hypothetical protein
LVVLIPEPEPLPDEPCPDGFEFPPQPETTAAINAASTTVAATERKIRWAIDVRVLMQRTTQRGAHRICKPLRAIHSYLES